MSIEITSSAFEDGGFIPAHYTCQGEDVSPALEFASVPAEAKSLA
ncbi:MAG: YbhB/YbcL family Raf kinase inhibitor-like protein, partial [Gemmatimonadetes bacterium]|nr:YbhB/YbcL family Raf kinase inhibitor-like protein [Gemmatimonadota bacterium]NIS02901.1 YbhB/YbcL family Raf kinase inhibitor-like protein [Gemmatimonadota bacterium]NIU52937.1 YbhB/YbcL family Raf kinase inhibitor-like protein [Gemmatimonadota bacterium]NIY45351.1 YbhB/YbcL family Raf kinase inhibitor-like protein [Gemmatimonadota bacterium]